MRIRLKSGVWLGGAFSQGPGDLSSYAAGYPDTRDLLLTPIAIVDPVTGEFGFSDEDTPSVRDGALLLRWDEIEYLEFIGSSGA